MIAVNHEYKAANKGSQAQGPDTGTTRLASTDRLGQARLTNGTSSTRTQAKQTGSSTTARTQAQKLSGVPGFNREAALKVAQADLPKAFNALKARAAARAKSLNPQLAEQANGKVVCMFSEFHNKGKKGVKTGKDTLKELIPRLKAEFGIDTIAFELPQKFNESFASGKGVKDMTGWLVSDADLPKVKANQKFLDECSRELASIVLGDEAGSDKDETKIFMRLSNKGSDFATKMLNHSEKEAEGAEGLQDWQDYYKLAKEHGLRTIAVDTTAVEHTGAQARATYGTGLWVFMNEFMEGALKKDLSADELKALEKQLITIAKIMKKLDDKSEESMRHRDATLAKNLQEDLLNKAEGSILFTGGALHCDYSLDSAARKLRDSGVPIVSMEAQSKGKREPFTYIVKLQTESKARFKKLFGVELTEHPQVGPVFKGILERQSERMGDKADIETLYSQVGGDSLDAPSIFSLPNLGLKGAKSAMGKLLRDSFDAVLLTPSGKKGGFWQTIKNIILWIPRKLGLIS